MAGIYADDGISGTSMENRSDLQRLIQDCENGRIDYVVTKSISRLARNTVDSLNVIRTLKKLNIPIYFEKENINTLEAAGKLMITVLSSLTQEESRNISENVRWGHKRGFEKGKVYLNNHILGYRKNDNGNLEVIPEEAEIVKQITGVIWKGTAIKGSRMN